MPKLNSMQTLNVAGNGNFQFSAIRTDKLGACEYTLVTIVVDTSSSVTGFNNELLACIQAIIGACQHSPRAENLMVRLLTFNSQRDEIHGFVPLTQIDPASYKPLQCRGATALYDACYDAIGATNTYATQLFQQDFSVNAAVYILTDGQDNVSNTNAEDVAKQVTQALRAEMLDSITTILVGVNTADGSASGYLQIFKDEAKLDQFIDIENATADTLAKLAAFVSKSIQVQSQSLGTGHAPKSLSF